MKLLLFGGTTEGRQLAWQLAERGIPVTVSVATALGAEELGQHPLIATLIGRREKAEMVQMLAGYTLCIDATHPYAVVASENIRAACEQAGVPLRRLLRPASAAAECRSFADCRRLAEFLQTQPGNVLLTTGAKELPAFAGLEPRRVFARVLPTHEGLAACEALHLPHRNILALQGPFTQKMNEAMLEQYNIAWLVTKDGGGPGGFAEKLAAAQNTGAQLLLVGRPPEQEGCSAEEILQEVLAWAEV